jgi:O-antigen/teichoic acid export membrane protein
VSGRHSARATRTSRRTGSSGRRLAITGVWAVADQGISSISNLLLAVLVGRASTPREFGAYSLAFAAYSLWVGLSRWIGGNIFMMRYSSLPRAEQRPHYRELTGIGLSAALFGSLVLVVGALVAGRPVASFFLVMAVLLPGLVVQDDWRQAMFAARDSRGAFLCDLLWLAVEVPLLVVAHAVTGGKAVGYIAAWGVGALVAALTFAIIHRAGPSIVGALRFIRANFGLVPSLFGEYLALSGGALLLPYAVALVLSLDAAGGLRAAQVIFGLAASPLMGLVPLAMVYCVRAYQSGGVRQLHRVQVALVGPGCVWVAAFTVAVQFIPGWLGRDLTGSSWGEGRHLLLALGVVFVAQWMSTVNLIAMRAAGNVKVVANIRVALTVVTLAATMGLAATSGLSGAVWGMAISAVFGAAVSAVASRKPSRRVAAPAGEHLTTTSSAEF